MRWRLVPVDPTDRMCDMGEGYNLRCGCGNCDHEAWQKVAEGYKAMLSAAPSAADDPAFVRDVAMSINRELRRQFDGMTAPGLPNDPESWTATGGTLDLSEIARAAIKAMEG